LDDIFRDSFFGDFSVSSTTASNDTTSTTTPQTTAVITISTPPLLKRKADDNGEIVPQSTVSVLDTVENVCVENDTKLTKDQKTSKKSQTY